MASFVQLGLRRECLPPVQGDVHRLRRVAHHLGHDVGVGVYGEAERAVAKDVDDRHRVHVLRRSNEADVWPVSASLLPPVPRDQPASTMAP